MKKRTLNTFTSYNKKLNKVSRGAVFWLNVNKRKKKQKNGCFFGFEPYSAKSVVFADFFKNAQNPHKLKKSSFFLKF